MLTHADSDIAPNIPVTYLICRVVSCHAKIFVLFCFVLAWFVYLFDSVTITVICINN